MSYTETTFAVQLCMHFLKRMGLPNTLIKNLHSPSVTWSPKTFLVLKLQVQFSPLMKIKHYGLKKVSFKVKYTQLFASVFYKLIKEN